MFIYFDQKIAMQHFLETETYITFNGFSTQHCR